MSSTRDSNIVVTQILEKLTENICIAEKALADKSFLFKLVQTKENKIYDAAITELRDQLAAIVGQLFLDSNPIEMLDDCYYLGDENLSREAIDFTSYSDKLKYIIIHEMHQNDKPGRIYARWVEVMRSAAVARNYMVVMGILSALISFSESKLKRMGVTVKSEDKSIIDRLSEFLADPADMIREFKTFDSIPQMSQLTGDLARVKEKLSLHLGDKEDGINKLVEMKSRLNIVIDAERIRLHNRPANGELLSLIKCLSLKKLKAQYENDTQTSPSRGRIEASSSVPSLKSKIQTVQYSVPPVRRVKTSGSIIIETKVESPRKKKSRLATSQEFPDSINTATSSSASPSSTQALSSPPRRKKSTRSSSSHIATRLLDAHSASSLPSMLESPLSDTSSSSMSPSPVRGKRSRKNSMLAQPDSPVRTRPRKKKSKNKGLFDRSMSTSSLLDKPPVMQVEPSQSSPTLEASVIEPIPFTVVTKTRVPESKKEAASPIQKPRAGSVAERIGIFEAIVKKTLEETENVVNRRQVKGSKLISRQRSQTAANSEEALVGVSLLRTPLRHIRRASSEVSLKKR